MKFANISHSTSRKFILLVQQMEISPMTELNQQVLQTVSNCKTTPTDTEKTEGNFQK